VSCAGAQTPPLSLRKCFLLLTRKCSLTYRDPQCRGFEAQTPPVSLAWHAPRVRWGPHCRQQVFSLSLSICLCVIVCVCVEGGRGGERERAREKESVCMCVCVNACVRAYKFIGSIVYVLGFRV
jgi:hypothetical protein